MAMERKGIRVKNIVSRLALLGLLLGLAAAPSLARDSAPTPPAAAQAQTGSQPIHLTWDRVGSPIEQVG